MSQSYRFFFSYARANYENARWTNPGGYEVNHLEQFFETLCRKVSDRTGDDLKEVAYRDQDKLQISELWSPEIVKGLQQSRVLVPMLSPHYLKRTNTNCLRELEFFRRRFNEWQQTHPNQLGSHKIVPIFWMDSINSLKEASEDIRNFFNSLQQKQKGMPDNYPTTGLSQFFCLNKTESIFTLIDKLAERIVDLSNEEPLPLSDTIVNFQDLPVTSTSDLATIAYGPTGTNVFYAVGTAEEMRLVGCKEIQSYGKEPQNWKPFVLEHPGATIKLITEEGLNAAGQEEPPFNLGQPEAILENIEKAKKRNSPVLIILDRCVLKLDRFKQAIEDYDSKNYFHVGLVTAGGTDITDEAMAKLCVFKFNRCEDHHIWAIPKNRESYVESVKEVITCLRNKLQDMKKPSIKVPSRQMPVLNISSVT